jgi:hypothetical protein
METAEAPAPFSFSSPEGYALCRSILKPLLPYDPHDHQLEGICKALDGVDVLALSSHWFWENRVSLYVFISCSRTCQQYFSLSQSKKVPKKPCCFSGLPHQLH